MPAFASPRFDVERFQKLWGHVPLDATILEVIVVRPDGKPQRQRQSEHIDIVRITLADATAGRLETGFAPGALKR